MAFKPGSSGNPAGRPKGTRDKRTQLRDILTSLSEDLLHKAVAMALDGNEQMLKLLLERILPAKPKDEPIEINLPHDNLMQQAKNITSAINDQRIGPSTALALIEYTRRQTSIIEFSELMSKIDELETLLQERPESNAGLALND